MKRYLPTLIALLALAGLGAYVWIYESKPKDEETEKIYEVAQEDIIKFELDDREKKASLACEKQPDETWLIVKPVRLIAEDDTVDIVTRHLAEPQVDRRLEPQGDLAPFGLGEPAYRASFTLKDGSSRALLVGDKNPPGTARFVMEEGGDTIFTVASYSAEGFMKTVKELRAKTLMRFETGDVTRLVVERIKADTLDFRKQEEGSWMLSSPFSAPADQYAVSGMLNDIKSLKGAEVLEDPDAYSLKRLDQPVAHVTVYTGTSTGQKLTLSKPKADREEAFATSSRLPFVFRLDSARVLTSVTKDAGEYRERLLLQADREDLTHVSVKSPAMEIICTKDAEGKWTVSKPEGKELGSEFDDMLFEIVYVRAEEFIDDSPKALSAYGLDPPRFTVVLTGSRDREPFATRYLLGKRRQENVCMKLAERPNVFGVRKEVLDKVERFADKIRTGGSEPSSGEAEEQD